MSLELRDVSYAFKGHVVVDIPDLVLSCGVTALIGNNGAGKTTLIRMLASVLQPRSGTITWGGESIYSDARRLREYRRALGWVPQIVHFPRGVSVSNYLAQVAWLREMPAGRTGELIREALDVTGLGDMDSRRIETLSGGMQRRLVLAGAVMGHPRVLLLDEPTVGLDPQQRAAFMDAVKQYSQRTVVLLSTHMLEDVVDTAERAVVLAGGHIVLDRAVKADERVQDLRTEFFRTDR